MQSTDPVHEAEVWLEQKRRLIREEIEQMNAAYQRTLEADQQREKCETIWGTFDIGGEA